MQNSKIRRFFARWRILDMKFWALLRRYYSRVMIVGFAIGIPLVLWSFWWEPNSLQVNQYKLEVERLPKGFDNIRVVAMSDLHVGSPYITLEKLQTVVKEANAQDPDLIVLLGDFVIQGIIGGEFIEPEKFVEVLKDLKAKQGVYAVLGNHDWIMGGERVAAAFERVGIRMLTNEAILLERNNSKLWLAGVGDFFTAHHDLKKLAETITTNDPVLALTHTPDVFLKLSPQFILTLAGHTHGGQVNLPLLGRAVVPSNYGQKYSIGDITEGEKRLFVTSGIGTSILSVRFRVPPEIAVLTLNAEARTQ
jgi:uncharacterized protein